MPSQNIKTIIDMISAHGKMRLKVPATETDFALILQTAFARGSLQITSDCSHIVWKDTNGRQYDIKGINEEETRPLENRKELIPQFLHGGEL